MTKRDRNFFDVPKPRKPRKVYVAYHIYDCEGCTQPQAASFNKKKIEKWVSENGIGDSTEITVLKIL